MICRLFFVWQKKLDHGDLLPLNKKHRSPEGEDLKLLSLLALSIVAFHKESINRKKIGSDLGGKLDLDDLNIDSQKDYIIEKEENKLRLSNDNDEENIDGTLVFDDLSSQDQDSVNEIPKSVFD